MTSELGLEARQLRVERGDAVVLEDLSFTCPPGTLTHLKGENGSGKTTLLRTLAGLIRPETGQVLWRGETLRGTQPLAAELILIGHHNGLNAELNARENLHFIATLAAASAHRDVGTALARVNAASFSERPVRDLSAGQRQRVALARLLLFDAKLWMLDEPFTALDGATREVIEDLIEEHLAHDGIALIATHQAFNAHREVQDITLQVSPC